MPWILPRGSLTFRLWPILTYGSNGHLCLLAFQTDLSPLTVLLVFAVDAMQL